MRKTTQFIPGLQDLESRFCLSHFHPKPHLWVGDWSAGLQFGAMGNHAVNDCTAAAVGHTEQIWNATSHRGWTPTDAQVIDFYARTSGYNGNPITDAGAYESDVLRAWRKPPGIGGHTINRIGRVNYHKDADLTNAVFTTVGGVELSLNLPMTVVAQANAFQPWSVVSTTDDGAPGSWGGHEVNVCGRLADGNFKVVSWGYTFEVTPQFIHTYGTECYAVASTDMFGTNGRAINGMSQAGVNAAFKSFVA